MVRPGKHLFGDVNEWKEHVKLPDPDSWDWEGNVERVKCLIDDRRLRKSTIPTGLYERMISFMDFMPAAMALIDEEQTDAIKDFFGAMTDLGCRVVDKLCENMPALDLIEIHDDWGSQKAPFFSMDVAYELFVPYMKQITDRIHDKGRRALLHSCGHNADRIQCYIDGGFDLWAPQPMNDLEYLYDNFGDKILLCVTPSETDLSQRSEDDQRAAARAFVDRFCQPGKPSLMSMDAYSRSTPAFLDEIYEYSRNKYLAV